MVSLSEGCEAAVNARTIFGCVQLSKCGEVSYRKEALFKAEMDCLLERWKVSNYV